MSYGWQQSLIGLGVTAIGSMIGVGLGLRKYRREQWWDRKAAAYTSILDAFFNIRRNADFYVRQFEVGSQTVDVNKDLQELAHRGNLELDRAIALGTFLLSREAAKILRDSTDAILGIGENLTPREEAEAWSEIATRYSLLLIDAAKADLGVTGGLELRFRGQQLTARLRS